MANEKPENCPHCKKPESTKPTNYEDLEIAEQEKIKKAIHDSRIALYAIVDKNQKMPKTVPEYLCFTCANDMASSCNSHETVAIVS